MKKLFKLSLLLLVVLMFSSCFKERIELELNEGSNKKIVITAWITDLDEPQTVLVNFSSDYFDSFGIDYIDDAEVSLTNDDEEFIMDYVGEGLYAMPTDWRGVEGDTYTLKVRFEGEEYSATNTMRKMSEVENIYSEISEEKLEEDSIVVYDLYFSFLDLPGEGDGYFGIDYLSGTSGGDTLVNGGFIDDEFIDGEFFEDISLTENSYNVGDTAILEVHSIGKDASRFLQDIISETFRDGLFDPAPVNVRSNFSNGAVGYFITSCSRKIEFVIE